jgi:pimeloyl-ACP methyl ester carboxylesterase
VIRDLLHTKATTTAEPTSVAGGAATHVSADAWFSAGARKPYDTLTKSMLASSTDDSALHVFERVVTGAGKLSTSTRWATFLRGFPDGSYGYSQVNELLGDRVTPGLFVEYLGQRDSDKPGHYKYSATERADLVEAQWANHRIQRTTILTFDYSSLVLMELLARQEERIAAGQPIAPRIDAVLIVNGGLFADAHATTLLRMVQ